MPETSKPALRALKERVEDWLWENHGDAFDAHLQWRHRVKRWMLYLRCYFIGHDVRYESPSYWSMEGSYYCGRCNGNDECATPFWERPTLPERLIETYLRIRWAGKRDEC